MANMLDWKGRHRPLDAREPAQLALVPRRRHRDRHEGRQQLDVIMLPKVEGPWDIHYADQLVAQLEAKAGVTRPILFHAILETGQGVALVEDICLASPRMQGISLGPADLAANRAMKTTRVGGGHPMYKVIEDPHADGHPPRRRPAGPVALYARQDGRCLRAGRHQALLRPLRRHLRPRCLRAAIQERLPHGLRRRLERSTLARSTSPSASSRPSPTK
jgi:hypothetical protein